MKLPNIIKIFNRLKGSKVKTSNKWNQEYARGKWEYLHSLNENGRYMVITGIIQNLFTQPKVLDLGCGTGIMASLLKPYGYNSYIGLDISETAIASAKKNDLSDTEFKTGDIEKYQINGTYDVIIFNEILYYLSKPIAAVSNYRQNLTSEGVIIASMVDWNRNSDIWNKLTKNFNFIFSTKVQTGQQPPWDIKVLR